MLIDRITENLDKGESVVGAFFKVFDTVNQILLL